MLRSLKVQAAHLPWRALLAVSSAVFAQALLEPPGRRFGWALPLYLIATGFTLWSFARKEWTPPLPQAEEKSPGTVEVRALPLLLSIPLMLAAFWEFGGGKFTCLNLALWLGAIGMLFLGLWVHTPAPAAAIPDAAKQVRKLIWLALVIAALGLTMFFRLNHIDSLPGEPFSDHAEKILDIYSISQGQYDIFFQRNTGREAIQMYWTLLIAGISGTGFSFLSLKLGTALLGILTLPYMYLLGKEFGSPRAGLFALFLFGIAYWPNVISRLGLRFPLYPLLLAPTLLYLVRGLRTRRANNFLLCGLFLGLGLHGYSPFRIVPFVVLAAFLIYLLHLQSRGTRRQAVWWLTVTGTVALYLFIPLLRYALDHPDIFASRAVSRLGVLDPAPAAAFIQAFLSNLVNGLLMFNWDDGGIWVNSLPHRPALDVVSGALFVIGMILLTARYSRERHWRDLLLLLSTPLLLMPSVLSLAFPAENPALNRAGGAAVSAILISALALDGLVNAFSPPREKYGGLEVPGASGRNPVGKNQTAAAYALTGVLLCAAVIHNYDLVFRQFNRQYHLGVWNTSEIGAVIQKFKVEYGTTDSVWIIPYSQWIDTRLPGMWIGILDRDFALWPEYLKDTVKIAGAKLFIFKPEDYKTENTLKVLYPDGRLNRYTLAVPGKDFMVFLVDK